jgi:hypothetical protein
VATNFYFNNFTSSAEQDLIAELVLESIKIYGLDVYYIPKREVDKDKIYGEDSLVEYNTSYLVDMYVKNVDGFEGEGDFLSKFNIEIRDQITFTVSKRNFENEISRQESGILRPQEGDLIFFPLNNKVFQIKFVEHEAVFYQIGSLQMYDLKCELFEYSNEVMNTGFDLIDNLQNNFSTSFNNFALLTENGLEITDEERYTITREEFDLDTQDTLADNDDIEIEADGILDFTEADPFSEGGRF